MKKPCMLIIRWGALTASFLIFMSWLASACSATTGTVVTTTTVTTTSPATTVTPTSTAMLNIWELKYRLFDMFPDYFWCDPDFYPIARPGTEVASAQEQFP